MTDAIQATGDFSPAEIISNDVSVAAVTENTNAAPQAAEPEVQDVPNGFVTLGLAPELIQAVKDLGFTQPTTMM